MHRNRKKKKASWHDWTSFANSDISNQCTVTVRNKFDILETSERHHMNDKYKLFVTPYIEAVAKCMLSKPNVKCPEFRKKNKITWKKASLPNTKNPTNANAEKLKKT